MSTIKCLLIIITTVIALIAVCMFLPGGFAYGFLAGWVAGMIIEKPLLNLCVV